MEKKKDNVLIALLVIVIIVILAIGVFMYMQKTGDDTTKTEENTIKIEAVLGTYEYDVPQEVKDEHGNYYDGITIELLTDNKFIYSYGEGIKLEGVVQIENNNVICNAKTIEGEYIDEQELNVKYTFKYSNNTLELTNKEGKVKFETSDYGIPNNPTEIKEIEEVHEEIGSKYVKE